MSSVLDPVRDKWEQMAPRERKLVALLVGAVVFCAAVLIARGIAGGLADLDRENDERREALRALAEHRASAGVRKKGVDIPETPTRLSNYVDKIINSVGIDSPSYPQPKETKKGKFIEYSFRLKLPKLTIVQMQQFLEQLEKESELVVVRELKIKRNFRDKERLDLDLQISTFATAAKTKKTKKKSESSGEEG